MQPEDGLVVIDGTAAGDVITASTPDPSSWSAMELDVEDPAGATAGTGCVQETPTRVSCADVIMLLVYGEDGDDTLTLDDGMIWTEVYGDGGADDVTGGDYIDGGDGPDRLTGGEGAYNLYGGAGDDMLRAGAGSWHTLHGEAGDDVLVGGPGDDTLDGGDGNDLLRGEEPGAATAALSGADWFDGGPGTDVATYEGRADALTVTLADDPSDEAPDTEDAWHDGAAGEGDDLDGIEDLRGGSGDDHLVGNGVANRIAGGPGNDTIDGAGGADRLGAAAFADGAEPGDDTVLARDGEVDAVACGDGADVAELDPLDVLEPLAGSGAACEQVTVAEYVPPPPPPAPAGSGDPATGTVAGGPGPSTPPGGGRLPYLPPGPGWVPRPPKPPAPLVLRRRRVVGHGTARVTVHVIPRGTLTATAPATVDGRTLVIARGRAVALSNRDVTVTLRATAAGRRALRTHHSLTVGLRLRLAPHAGTRIVTLSGGAFQLRW